MAEDKNLLDKIRDTYYKYDKKLTDAVNYYLIPPEARPLARGIESLVPFQDLPDATEFIQNPSLKTGLDLATDTAITAAELTPFGYLASRGATLPGKAAQEVIEGVKPVDDIINEPISKKSTVKSTNLDDEILKKIQKGDELSRIITDIGEEKLKTFSKQADLIRFIKEEYGVDIGRDVISKRIKKGDFSIKDKVKVDEEFKVNENFKKLFADNKYEVNRVGKNKANNILEEFLKLDETFVLGAKNPELIKHLKTVGIDANTDTITRMRGFYKKYKGIDLTGKRGVAQFINFDDSKVSDILQDVALGNIPKYKAARMLEELFPNSGFVRKNVPNEITGYFTKFYNSYIDQLDDDVLKSFLASGKESPRSVFNALNVGDKVTPKAGGALKFSTIFDDTGKTFTQTKRSFLNNDIAKTLVNKTKNLFQDKSIKLFDVDHIQAPRFGGTNAESNLRLITKADHTSLKTLPTNKTLATDVVKAKTGFENEYYNLSTKLIDNIKNDNYMAADKIAESLRVMIDNFKNTYKNVDFIVGQPHVAIKTSDNTAKYIKYGDDVKLSSKQKKYIEDNNLLPEQSNLPNAGKPIEKQAEDIYQGYLQIYNLIGEIPSGSIGKVAGDITSMNVPRPIDINVRKGFSGMKDGGMVGISHLTRPL